MKKAQSIMQPSDASVIMARIPREYVHDAVLRYEFNESHHVRSHYTDEHPGEHKCILRVYVPDLGLEGPQRQLLQEIAAQRYCTGSQVLKIVSRKYLNKVYYIFMFVSVFCVFSVSKIKFNRLASIT